jgi:AcrR family transcriptional regulator
MEAIPIPVPPKPSEVPARPARMPGEDRRRQLLRVAIESFAQNGFSGTKTKDIAAAAGVSEAILFRHFASKEDLYHAILDEKEATLGGERWFVEMNELAERRDDRGLFQHVVLGAKNFPPSDEVIVEQFVDLVLGGLEQRSAPGRIAKGKQK